MGGQRFLGALAIGSRKTCSGTCDGLLQKTYEQVPGAVAGVQRFTQAFGP
jgi:hypothetical protein